MMKYIIEPMKVEDIDEVANIERLSFKSPYSKRLLLDELRGENHVYLVAKSNDKVIGYGGMWYILDEAHINNIAIHPDFRRMGIGGGLVKELIKNASHSGMKAMTLEVRKSNVAAIEMYTLAGFEGVGYRKGYYEDSEDALIMWKHDLTDGKESLNVLAIETSCDETSASIVSGGRKILSNVISSQIELHRKFGGVVPEIAARKHVEMIIPVVDEAIKQSGLDISQIDAVASTYGPGLVGALLVGLTGAKAMAMALDVPFIGVNHIEGHIYSNILAHEDLAPPFLCLTVSGGHTELVIVKDHGVYEVLGKTKDDAMGEAFDKVGRTLGLPYPAGPVIDELAKRGDPTYVKLPKTKVADNYYDFSFSGIKTATINYINTMKQRGEEINSENLLASFQDVVTDEVIRRIELALKDSGLKDIAISGGVSANSQLRHKLDVLSKKLGVRAYYPPINLCTDNAAMIASLAYFKLIRNEVSPMSLNAIPQLKLDTK